MTLKYIYNEFGKAESVVLPIEYWQKLTEMLKNNKKMQPVSRFNPAEFRGTIKHLNLNIEEEIRKMRKEWANNT